MNGTKTMLFHVPVKVHAKFKKACIMNEVTMTEVLVTMMKDYTKKNKKK